ncbi:MAG: PEGA domain-containing protein [Patescibacteria group bacterium]
MNESAQNSPVKKIAFYTFICIGVVAAIALILKIYSEKDKLFGQSGISVETPKEEAQVYLDGKELGKTPLSLQTVKPGSHAVKVQKADGSGSAFEANLKFVPFSTVVITQDLGISNTFSSGQVFWFDPKDLSSKINIVSEPSQATVYVDDTEVGKTPYSSSVLSDGGYDIKLIKDGFESQTARIKIQKDTKLNASFKLLLLPVPDKPILFTNSKIVYDLSSQEETLTLDIPNWIKGIDYYTRSRNTTVRYSYFVDHTGKIYDASGKELVDEKLTLKSGDLVGYLGKKAEEGFSESAKTALTKFVGLDIGGGKRVKVLATPTGWLRVRSQPSLNGEEIARINVGEEVTFVEEKDGWTKVILKDGKEGYVSTAYVTEVK